MKFLPETDTLKSYLSDLIIRDNLSEKLIEIISRKTSDYTSTFPIEIVTCQLNDGQIIKLFCKYLGGMGPNNFGHKGGVEYESKVYNKVLKDVSLPKPKYYGTCYFPNNDETLLVLEYLEGSDRLHLTVSPETWLKEAGLWIAHFHNFKQTNIPSFLKVYNKAYYTHWAKRVQNLVNKSNSDYGWIINLCNSFMKNIDILLDNPQSIIHGEYYPKNIIIQNNTIYPIDWESTAVATGEIDLASLIEGWDENTIEQVKEIYLSARWPEGKFSKKKFDQRLLMSQLYFCFRWLGEELDLESWIQNPVTLKEFLRLEQQAHCIIR